MRENSKSQTNRNDHHGQVQNSTVWNVVLAYPRRVCLRLRLWHFSDYAD